jgi:hypothetical protein
VQLHEIHTCRLIHVLCRSGCFVSTVFHGRSLLTRARVERSLEPVHGRHAKKITVLPKAANIIPETINMVILGGALALRQARFRAVVRRARSHSPTTEPNALCAKRSVLVLMQPLEAVRENAIGNALALGATFSLIETPMDAEINAALAVLFFGLRKTGETPRHVGAHLALVVSGYPIKFVGNKGEAEPISSKKSAQRLEQAPPKPAWPDG